MTSITDWVDARRVPASQGAFDLDSYIDYLVAMLRELSPNLHVLAVRQSAVPVLAAVALLEAEQDPSPPLSMTLIGGPIETAGRPPVSTSLRRSAAPTGSAAIASSRCRCRVAQPLLFAPTDPTVRRYRSGLFRKDPRRVDHFCHAWWIAGSGRGKAVRSWR